MTATASLRAGVLARVDPVAKLAAVAVVAACLLVSIDPVSAAVALLLQLGLLAAARIPIRENALRLLPLLVAAPLAGITTVLYGQPSGRTYLHWLVVDVSDGSISLGVATALRVLALGVPGVLLLASIDPTDLADGLAQIVRLPARFVMGGLAGLRLLGLLVDDWRTLERARRARGVADRGRLRRLAGQTFALVVQSLRRGAVLATAMEARGFGAPGRRTWAREARLGRPDAVLLALAVAVGAASVLVAVAVGAWNPVLGG